MQNLDLLKKRFRIFRIVRDFFYSKGLSEVDCPLASKSRIVEPNIDLVPVFVNGDKRWLCPSPEVGMKKLLAEGMENIFQLSSVFRNGEYGEKHSSEFTLLEWYRVGISFEEIIEETTELIHLVCGYFPAHACTYASLFEQHFQINPHTCNREDLILIFEKNGFETYPGLIEAPKSDMLNFLMGSHIEPRFPSDQITIVTDYPAHQTLMSRLKVIDGYEVAIRFEIYLKGIELANGSQEETKHERQIKEIQEKYHDYTKRTEESIVLDESFLKALTKGLPECCGVALGMDRLCMIALGAKTIDEVRIPSY
ncbi:EF-P lysine aminoacylase EpmA [Candidatus Similichlamydia epinepheli]|uniref:EF-P lysine aminoacylase EpmA n=1 Tax=Candidatus Similichlamydia epinepheli TaxID=1903953 RepID=UPI001300206E|nr:EF-P lysine aminoacylase EpmA [Candidatus Similichlamydia epinepheli]